MDDCRPISWTVCGAHVKSDHFELPVRQLCGEFHVQAFASRHSALAGWSTIEDVIANLLLDLGKGPQPPPPFRFRENLGAIEPMSTQELTTIGL